MRCKWLALITVVTFVQHSRGGDLRNFEDAALHAVQFVDDKEGWAVGDDGVIWHSIDGGQNWERQATGVRASLRSLHFVNPFTGWVVGREELPFGAGSSGVLLYTNDGGERWQRVSLNAMPGLHQVRFVDEKTGYLVGEGTEQFPSGVFITKNGGKNWAPLAGPRTPGWLAADFSGPEDGALVGTWNRVATLRGGNVVLANVDSLGGRNIRSLFLAKGKGRSVAVGQGGLILLSDNEGTKWSYPELRMPAEVLACWDLHAVHGSGKKLWAAGRPGSVLLHSKDGGLNWETQRTGQPLPLNGLYFQSEQQGWAVGELGTILATTDAGKTWKVQQRGGRRASLLFVHARSGGLPADTVARLGGDDGYLTAAVRLMTADSTNAPFASAAEPDRQAAAMRAAGGAASESLWQFPVPFHLDGNNKDDLIKCWDSLHGSKASEQMLRQLVLSIRVWRPDVLVTDSPEPGVGGSPLDPLAAEAVREAFNRAADPKVFPEQIMHLGLEPWQPGKAYGLSAEGGKASVKLNLSELRPRLQASARDFAADAAGLLAGEAVVLPRQRCFRLLSSSIDGAEAHTSFFEGIKPTLVGDGRRKPTVVPEMTRELQKTLRARDTVLKIAETPLKGLTDPDRLLTNIAPMLNELPESMAAPAAHAIASQFVRLGQWHLVREAFLGMVERYPAHPLTADAFRWLIRHNSSSETRRRHELGQFLITRTLEGKLDPMGGAVGLSPVAKKGADGKVIADTQDPQQIAEDARQKTQADWAQVKDVIHSTSREESLRWYQGSLKLEQGLQAFGAILADDPGIQFCLHAARRNVGDFEASSKWFMDFVDHQPPGPWRDAAAAELWLVNRQGQPPKPIVTCKHVETRPMLDGKLDDACWREITPIKLQDATGGSSKEAPTKVWLAYDKDFLYIGLRCEHTADHHVTPVKGRQRDADLKPYDRVSLLIDLDRDYATAFHFQVDQRGCVREDCWGDATWNPKWFVAVHSEQTVWQIEAAIPLTALTGDVITSGRTWSMNVVRQLPGQGVQSWSLPAGDPERQKNLEGMGLLMFRFDGKQEAGRPAGRMQRVP